MDWIESLQHKFEYFIKFFQRETVYFTLKNLVLDGAVNISRALKILQLVILHKAGIIRITLHIDLIDFNFHKHLQLLFLFYERKIRTATLKSFI